MIELLIPVVDAINSMDDPVRFLFHDTFPSVYAFFRQAGFTIWEDGNMTISLTPRITPDMIVTRN